MSQTGTDHFPSPNPSLWQLPKPPIPQYSSFPSSLPSCPCPPMGHVGHRDTQWKSFEESSWLPFSVPRLLSGLLLCILTWRRLFLNGRGLALLRHCDFLVAQTAWGKALGITQKATVGSPQFFLSYPSPTVPFSNTSVFCCLTHSAKTGPPARLSPGCLAGASLVTHPPPPTCPSFPPLLQERCCSCCGDNWKQVRKLKGETCTLIPKLYVKKNLHCQNQV